jgi:hypothetical protein
MRKEERGKRNEKRGLKSKKLKTIYKTNTK